LYSPNSLWLRYRSLNMQVLKVIFILLEVLALFNLLIFVHELGHFLAARWRGLKVERFAIWFGKPIWKKESNGVEYVLGCIPAGGYVSLPQMAPMEAIEGMGDSVKWRIVRSERTTIPIMVERDGCVTNCMVTPIKEKTRAWERKSLRQIMISPAYTPIVGEVISNSPANRAGLRVNDEIL